MSLVLEERAEAGLLQLGLTVAAAQLDTLAQTAAAKNWSYSHFLGALLDGELQARHDKRVALNLQFAKFPYLKRLEEFDFSAQPAIDRRLIEELATGRYLAEGRNLLFLGPPGVGKTHLAIALGVKVAEMGHRVYFTAAMDLARKLTRAVDANRLHRELNALMQPKLLIIDEIGYLPFDSVQASLLFQVICRRYQKNQTLALTSNKAFSDWGQVFADDPIMASAALDRLLHRSTVINIRGESYRLKEKRQAGHSLMSVPPVMPV
jgi:DNA replication protein DnaC